MRSADRTEFGRLLVALAAMKPGGKLTDESLELWWLSMADWSLEDFRAAASHLARSVEYMPSPFHFEQLRKAAQTTPSEAWTVALAFCKHWRDPEVQPDGRIARAAAAVGGLRAIAMADTEKDLPHVQRRFLQAYAELSEVEAVREALPQIAPAPLRLLGVQDNGFVRIGHGDAQH